MIGGLAHKLRLRPTILLLFLLLTVPIFFATVWNTYVSNDQIAEANADSLIARFRKEAVQNIADMFEPIKSLVRSASVLGTQQPDFYSDNRALKYLFSILSHSDRLVAVYVGMEDGSFRQARRINPNVEVQDKPPPKGVAFAYRWIEALGTGPRIDHYVFLNANHDPIGSSQQETNYDPRPRLWYRKTVERDGIYITDPDIFAVFGLIGFTIADPIKVGGKTVGVAAADMTLNGLSEFLAQSRISPNTTSYILNEQDGVIADSNGDKTYTIVGGQIQLRHIASLGNKLSATAYYDRPAHGEQSYSFSYNGRQYVASYTTLPLQLGSTWRLLIVTPLDDFTRTFREHNIKLLIIGLAAIALDIVIIYFLSAALSRPLERLARKVVRIEALSDEEFRPLNSPVRELSILSKAIDELAITVRSFASFVPVGLVKQLLNTDQRLELGGHSRFLTIFFSDLEAFSTLTESVPSQSLVSRISAYLEVVTRAVTEESGTIDKFIGDGVMAFWGAPALLEDHAWHACVAALRIKNELDGLNEEWAKERQKPLNIRIGIHSDAVIVGNIGSKSRMAYTVMGDGVNVASRLEGVNKSYGTHICISHAVYREAGHRLCVRPIDEVLVKGRRGKIPIYELMGAYEAGPELEPDASTLRLCELTQLAYESLVQENFTLALARYKKVLDEFPEDSVAMEIVKRLAVTESTRRIHRQASD